MSTAPAPSSDPQGALEAPRTTRGRLLLIGPGIVLALSSVGASDMITTMNSGAEHGLALIWVFTVGVLLKFVLSDAVARLQMSGDRSLMSHMTAFGGRLFPAVFLVAELLVGLFFGASVVSVCTLILQSLLPGLPFWPTAIVVLGSAVALLWTGRYGLMEKVMMGFGVLMFIGIVSLAITTVRGQEAQEIASQTIIPAMPEGSLITVLSLIGGVGGATGILAYSFWIREKAWRGAQWKATIRTDLVISYGVVLIFAIAMTMVGAFLLYGQGFTISDNGAMFAMADSLGASLGGFVRLVFLLSFLAVVYTSVLGGFSGIAYVTADCLRVLRRYPDQDAPGLDMSARAPEFRIALVYRTVCALSIMGTGRPVTLVLIYAAISAFILPVLALALLVLLNRGGLDETLRNRTPANILLVICFLLFGVLAAMQVVESVGGLLG